MAIERIQLKPNPSLQYSYQNPYAIQRKVDYNLYENIREKLPTVDAIFNRITALDGYIVVTGENKDVVRVIEDWLEKVQVNDLSRGFDSFLQTWSTEALEQGFSFGEFIPNQNFTDIIQLRVADSKTIKFYRNPDLTLKITQRVSGDIEERTLNPNTLLYYAPYTEEQNPYGIPLMRSCEFVTKILQSLQTAMRNASDRFADPWLQVTAYLASQNYDEIQAKKEELKKDVEAWNEAKRAGKTADFVYAVSRFSDYTEDVVIKVIAEGLDFKFEIPLNHVIEQIVSKSGLPSWLFGIMPQSLTQKVAELQMSVASSEIQKRQRVKYPEIKRLIETLLLLRNISYQPGDWNIEFKSVNIHDIVSEARARFLNAQADAMLINVSTTNNITDDSDASMDSDTLDNPDIASKAHGNNCDCGNHSYKGHVIKQETRPLAWPQLDRIETDFENYLKQEWEDLYEDVLYIAGLTRVTKQTEEEQPFEITNDQYSFIDTRYEAYLDEINPDNPQSLFNWYYNQGFGAGLVKALEQKGITGEEAAFGLEQNAKFFNEIIINGFTLLKQRSQINIDRLKSAMDAGVISGKNPRDVALELEKKFGQANSDWERLARTEMATAAETAKTKEWAERKVEKVEFDPSPDACPQCEGLAGIYEIDEAPIPGYGTHPRCRCTLLPV